MVVDELRTRRVLNSEALVLFPVLQRRRHLVNTDMQPRSQTVRRAGGRAAGGLERAKSALIFIHAPAKRQFFAVLSGL